MIKSLFHRVSLPLYIFRRRNGLWTHQTPFYFLLIFCKKLLWLWLGEYCGLGILWWGWRFSLWEILAPEEIFYLLESCVHFQDVDIGLLLLFTTKERLFYIAAKLISFFFSLLNFLTPIGMISFSPSPPNLPHPPANIVPNGPPIIPPTE